MTVLGSWCRPVEEWFPDRASGSLCESWGGWLCWGPWSCFWLWHVVVWVAWWGSVMALPCWMLPCFDFPISVSFHFLIIFAVTIPFRRYCPSLPAFSMPTAGCSKSNAVNSRFSLMRGTAFPVLCLIELLCFAFTLQLKAQSLWLLLVWGILRNYTQE